MAKIHLWDLLDRSLLQQIQDGFSDITGMAALITDEAGIPITKESHFEKFCEMTRRSEQGCCRCEACDRLGAKNAIKSGTVEMYNCHGGLYDFSAPIIVDGRFLGAFVGGQVLLKPLASDQVLELASELDIASDMYQKAAEKIQIVTEEQLVKSASYANELANMLSQMAFRIYMNLSQNKVQDNTAQVKSEFLTQVNYKIHKPLQEMLFTMQGIAKGKLSPEDAERLSQAEKLNRKVLNVLADVIEYSELTETDSDICETDYNLQKLCEGLKVMYTGKLMNRPIQFRMEIEEGTPEILFGDVTRIRQILINLLNNAVQYTSEGMIMLRIMDDRNAYGLNLIFEIIDSGCGMNQEQVEVIQKLFESVNERHVIEEEILEFGLGITCQLVTAVYGQLEVESKMGEGSVFRVIIPQMEAELF